MLCRLPEGVLPAVGDFEGARAEHDLRVPSAGGNIERSDIGVLGAAG